MPFELDRGDSFRACGFGTISWSDNLDADSAFLKDVCRLGRASDKLAESADCSLEFVKGPLGCNTRDDYRSLAITQRKTIRGRIDDSVQFPLYSLLIVPRLLYLGTKDGQEFC